MRLFVVLSFVVLALAYWELSGGADFEPEFRSAAVDGAPQPTVEAAPDPALQPASQAEDVPAEATAAAEPSPTEAPPTEAPPSAERVSPEEAPTALAPEAPPPETTAAVAPETAAAPAPAPDAAADATGGELRRVTGDRVNMREGPGTSFAVVGQMTAGETAEVLEERDGWVWVRAGTGAEGWMSARFLAASGG